MREIVILSGKGGTGKTTLAALVAVRSGCCVVDADVDAANLGLVLEGTDGEACAFYAGHRARVLPDRCESCGRCESVCAFGALTIEADMARIRQLACEGCGACVDTCPFDAIGLIPNRAGQHWVRQLESGTLVHAELGVAQDNSGKLVSEVRRVGRATAERAGSAFLLIDGPPGIGCPVHAALTGTQLAVLVAEATPSGQHDLDRLTELCRRFRVPAVVILNKCGVAPPVERAIERACDTRGARLVGHIPFDLEISRLLAESRLPTHVDSDAGRAFREAADVVHSLALAPA